MLAGAKRMKAGWENYTIFSRGFWNSAGATAGIRMKCAEASVNPVSTYSTALQDMEDIEERRTIRNKATSQKVQDN